MANYKITKEEKLEKSQIKLTVELTDETVAHYEEKALTDVEKMSRWTDSEKEKFRQRCSKKR